jgi:hypothetical protein
MVHHSKQVLDSCVDNSRGGACKICRGVFECTKDAIYDVHERYQHCAMTGSISRISSNMQDTLKN